MKSSAEHQPASRSGTLALAGLFGLVFGFLLQKGGVAKFHVLIGVLLLEDFTVIKVMGSAIIVGMIGVFILRSRGKVELHLQPLRWGPQILGGLLFGVGFALLAYCPGTGAAALGQGNWDALFGMAGLVAGSYLFAMMSGPIGRTVGRWGDCGKKMLPELVPAPTWVVVAAVAVLLTAALFWLEQLDGR
jgi:uncharacterized membrane protein YedE/YeeE